jgi:hypothetical protein
MPGKPRLTLNTTWIAPFTSGLHECGTSDDRLDFFDFLDIRPPFEK